MDVLGYHLVLGWPTATASLIILALLGFALLDPWLRSWRTVFAALLAIVMIVAAVALPLIPRTIIRSAVVTAYGLAILFANRGFWSLPRADGEFARACRTTLSRFSALARRIDSASHAEYTDEFAAITDELKRLAAPSEDLASGSRRGCRRSNAAPHPLALGGHADRRRI